jgi:site-specific DNA-cytosine methylase
MAKAGGFLSNIKSIEFFSGLGGWRYALEEPGQVISAYDISDIANRAYLHNFGVEPHALELASVPASVIEKSGANTWLMSPPCQPYCKMGKGLDLEDPRSAAFRHLINLIPLAGPKRIILENVEGFLVSNAFALLSERLKSTGMKWCCISLCPTQFGIPNRRPRVYVVADTDEPRLEKPPFVKPCLIAEYLDATEDVSLYLSTETLARHGSGMDMVTKDSCCSACFIGGYGKRFVGSGSFLKTSKGVRRFSPKEISRLLGYPSEFSFPSGIPLNKQYKLLGNGLNLVVARWVVNQVCQT